MVSPARSAAYRILRSVNEGHADLPAALAAARRKLTDERDRTLAAEIATGTLRWQAELDHVVHAFARRTLDRLDPEVLAILRLTAYQILHLDRVPATAAVNDAVDLCRQAGKGSATGFVNAVLRSIVRNRSPLPARAAEDDLERALDYLSITLSHPRWLAARWMSRYGLDAAESWARFNNSPAPLTLRANTLRMSRAGLADALSALGVDTEPARYAPDALVVTGGNPLRTPLAGEGAFLLQDEASQLVALFTRVAPGEKVFDACASPGGKTLAMAAMGHDEGLIVAADFRPRRVALLRETIANAKTRSVRVIQTDARGPLPLRATFDCVLVDAPCSGLGTIRRDPEIRWRRSESDLPVHAALQAALLKQTSELVRPGGRLVYSTCSSEPEENDTVIEAFLSSGDEFLLDDPRRTGDVPAGLAAVLDRNGCLRTLPHEHGLESFFAAMLRRRSRTGADGL
jgi:16S rRNA (cytosine967-C5)-methyltransferase